MKGKTKKQLMEEIESLRQEVAALEQEKTERKRVEEALQQSEQNFRNSLDNSPLGIRIVTAEGELLYANQAILDIYGYSSVAELKTMPAKQRYTPESYAQHQERKQKRKLGQPVPSQYEISIVRKDGEVRHLSVSRREVIWDGETQFQSLYQDITERKEAREALRRSEENWRTLLENIPDFIMTLDRKGIAHYVNRTAPDPSQIPNVKPEDMIGKPVFNLIKPEFRSLHKKRLQQAFRTGKSVELEFTSIFDRIICSHLVPVKYKGNVVEVMAIAQDITERKQAEETLKSERDKLQGLMNGLARTEIGIDIVGIDYKILFQNQTLKQRFGDLTGKLCYEEYMELEKPCDICPMIEAVKNRKLESTELTAADGRTYELLSAPLPNPDGTVDKAIEVIKDITERKRAQEERLRLSAAVRISTDSITLTDVEGKLIEMNEATLEMYGADDERDLIGKSAFDLVDPEEREKLFACMAEVLDKGYVRNLECLVTTKNDRRRPVEISIALLKDAEGEPTGFVGITRDITERKRAEQALQESEERYRAIFEQAADSIVLIAAETGALVEFNDKAHENLGYTRAEFKKIKIPDFDVSESTEEVAKHIEKIIREGADTFETKHRTKGGEIRDIQVSSKAISIGGRGFVQSIWRDITERKQAEEEIRKFKTISDRAGYGVAISDLEGNLLYLNKSFAQMHRYTADELIVKNLSIFHNEKQMKKVNRLNEKLRQEGSFAAEEVWHKRKDDTVFPTLMSGTLIKDEKGTSLFMAATVIDITERKRAEEALRESEERYRGLFENSIEAVFASDFDGNLTSCNAAAEKLTGYTSEELSTMKPMETIPPESSEFALEQYRKVLSTGESIRDLVFEIVRKDGQRRLVEECLSPIRKENRIVGCQGALRDITERKQAEEELESSRQQLRNLAAHAESAREGERTRIAREMHDEMGQALTALKMDLAWLNNALPQDQIPLLEKTKTMSKLTDSAIKAVKRIATDLRPGILDDLGLAAAVEWQAGEFQKRTGIECEVSLDPADISLDEVLSTAIFRVLQETLTNVVRHAQATKVKIILEEKADKLVLEVADNGRGITKKQISNPKSLGLVGMRERVLPWQGEVEISGIPGEGTTVAVNIPLGEKGEIP